jgi:hypothetical protein
MMDSLNKLNSIIMSYDENTWLENLIQTNWIKYSSLILNNSKKIAEYINSGISLLLRCSDGI